MNYRDIDIKKEKVKEGDEIFNRIRNKWVLLSKDSIYSANEYPDCFRDKKFRRPNPKKKIG